MRQPSVYTRAQIIDAAFTLLTDEGWSVISARTVAKKLGSSTMPIYSHMKSIEELEAALKEKCLEKQLEYQSKIYTGDELLDIAVGYVVFARDEKQLFKFLYIDRPVGAPDNDIAAQKAHFHSQFGTESSKSRELQEVPEGIQKYLIQNSYIFSHGLAMLVNAGMIQPCSDEILATYLQQAGEAFYLLGMSKESNSYE